MPKHIAYGDNGKECDLEHACQDYKETGRCIRVFTVISKKQWENIAAD